MSKFTIEKKMYAQVRYFETLYKIKDADGEVIFTGSEEMAKKLLKILGTQKPKRKARK